jgi:hypothetical protein
MNNNKKSKQTFKAFTDKSIDKGLIGQKATIASTSVSSHEQDTATRRTVPRVHVDSTTYYNNADQKEPWMELFQTADFEQLHSKIYDQVENIICDNDYYDHPFVRKWQALKSNGQKYALTNKMSWRNAKLCLDINDLNQYREFILSCPTIKQRIRLK